MPSRADLAKIHIAKKELGLTDDEYRDIMRHRFGKDSAAMLTPGQARRLLSYFRSRGWRPRRQRSLPGMEVPPDPQSRKCLALWITLHKSGAVRHASDRALHAFVRRVTGRDHLRWCTVQEKGEVIEALKAWAKREGVNVD